MRQKRERDLGCTKSWVIWAFHWQISGSHGQTLPLENAISLMQKKKLHIYIYIYLDLPSSHESRQQSQNNGHVTPIFRLGVSQDVDGFIDQFIDQVVGLFSQTGSIPRQVAPMDDG